MISPSSQKRVERFVDQFIRSRAVEQLTSERDGDFINEPERAARVHDVAEFGADGKTHADVIKDWRDAFDTQYFSLMRERERKNFMKDIEPRMPERFIAAVNAYFDEVEAWHEKNGSLWQEIG